MNTSFHHMLMRTYFCFHKQVMDGAKREGLTSGQPKILEFLLRSPGVEQKTIAENCEIEAATVGNLLGRMESAGLIERRREGGNRRSIFVYLTEGGKAAARKVEEIFARAEEKAFAGMSEQEAENLSKSLKKVYQNISNKEE